MFKPIMRIAAAALVAGAIAFAITAAPAANDHEAKPGHEAKQALPFAKADRLRVPLKGAACSLHGWPNFEPKCQFDVREPPAKRGPFGSSPFAKGAAFSRGTRRGPLALLLLQCHRRIVPLARVIDRDLNHRVALLELRACRHGIF